MVNLSIEEKRALEEVFTILDDRKNGEMQSIKKYFMFCIKIFLGKKLLPARG